LTALQGTLRDAEVPNETRDPASNNAPATSTRKCVEIVVERNRDPINEFENNDLLLTQAFPWLYLFGKGVPKSSTMPRPYTKAVLNHYNRSFSKDHKFIFLLFDQMRRHIAAQAAKARLYSQNQNITQFVEFVNEPGFANDLDFAVKTPESKEAKKILAKLLPNIKMAGGNVPFGPLERQQSKYNLFAMLHRFGVPTFFLTITPNEIHSPLCIR
jgi:hypothetical protein